jgi:hypothetical protein
VTDEKNSAKKIYIVIEKNRGDGETICGVYRHKKSAKIEVGDSRSYRYEEHEIIEDKYD